MPKYYIRNSLHRDRSANISTSGDGKYTKRDKSDICLIHKRYQWSLWMAMGGACAVCCTGVRGATSMAEPLLLTRFLSAGRGGEEMGAFSTLGSTSRPRMLPADPWALPLLLRFGQSRKHSWQRLRQSWQTPGKEEWRVMREGAIQDAVTSSLNRTCDIMKTDARRQ